jgi:hypothetical protein
MSALATIALIAFYFVGFVRPASSSWNPSAANALLQAWRYLALGLGPAASSAWPWSGVAVVLFGLLTSTYLVRAWIQQPEQRVRVGALAAWSLSIVSMAVVTGVVRGTPANQAGFFTRYVPLPALWWCGGLLALAVFAPAKVARWTGVFVVVALLALLPAHLRFLREHGVRNQGVTDAFAVDVAQGLELEALADRHASRFHNVRQVFGDRLRAMHALGMWPALEAYAQRRTQRDGSRMISPLHIDPKQAATQRWLGAEFVLLVPADCALSYPVQAYARHFEAAFGVHPLFYEIRKTPGLRFTVELLRPGAPAEMLLDRTLRPGEEHSDRGFQEFSVDLPALSEASSLVLRTHSLSTTPDEQTHGLWNRTRTR